MESKIKSLRFSERLVNLARARDRLRFVTQIVPWKYGDAIDEVEDQNAPWIKFNKGRMAQAMDATKTVLGVVENECLQLLAIELGCDPLTFVESEVKVPLFIKEAFESSFEDEIYGATKGDIERAIQAGLSIVYYEGGWNGKEITFHVIRFPSGLDASVIEVWWGIANPYEASSFLINRGANVWEVNHVEE